MSEWRRGWPVLFGATIGMGAGLSMFIQVSGLFVKPLQAEFGWSRGVISMTSGAVLLTSLTMPLIGVFVDRYGPRMLVGLGALAYAGLYAALASMPGAPWIYLVILSLIGVVAGPATAPLVFVRPIVEVFERSRGMALAIGMSGASLASILILPVLQRMIAGHGWRAGYWLMAPLSLGLGGLSFLLLGQGARRKRDFAAATTATRDPDAGVGLALAMRDARFWLIAVSMVAANLAGGAFSSQLQPLLSDGGMAGRTAALFGSGYALAALIGRLVVGRLLDRFWAPVVAALALSGPVLGLLVFVGKGASPGLLAVGLVLIAIAQGAEGDLLAYFTVRCFGQRAFGVIFGLLGLMLGVSVAVGGMAAGFLFDRFGDYHAVLIGGSALFAIAASAILATGLIRPTPVADGVGLAERA